MLGNFAYLQSQTLLQALEQEYTNYELEQERLERKLADLERRAERQDDLIELAKHAENVLANWQHMSLMDQRAVAQAFIAKIVVKPTGKRRVADVEICWRDNSSDTVVLPYRADKWVLWMPRETEILSNLIQENASQVEISSALPDRNWNAIRIKAYEIIGERNFQVSPKPIRDEEKYTDYVARVEKEGAKANRTSGIGTVIG